MVINTTFNNISVISWRSVLLVGKTGGPGENHRPVTNRRQTLSINVSYLQITCGNHGHLGKRSPFLYMFLPFFFIVFLVTNCHKCFIVVKYPPKKYNVNQLFFF